jgi:hypothetical protein
MTTGKLQQQIEAAAKREQARVASDLADAQIRVVTAAFSQGAAYTNLITLGAYAGFFGLWQLTENYISKQQALWAALLILVSLCVFIMFEVYKMTFFSRQFFARAQLLNSPEARSNPNVLLQKLSELELLQQGQAAFSMRVWMVALATTVGFGVVAAGILAYAFVTGLLQ